MIFKYVYGLFLILVLSACTTNGLVDKRKPVASTENRQEKFIEMLVESNGSPWVFIGSSVTGVNYYLNVESIKKHNGYESLIYKNGGYDSTEQHVKAWWKAVKGNGDYDQIQSKFYCSKEAAINTSGVMYSKDGLYIGDLIIDKFVAPLIPNTVHADIANMACKLSK